MRRVSKLLTMAAGAGLAALGGCQPAERAQTLTGPTRDLALATAAAARPLADRDGRPACGNVMYRTASPRR